MSFVESIVTGAIIDYFSQEYSDQPPVTEDQCAEISDVILSRFKEYKLHIVGTGVATPRPRPPLVESATERFFDEREK